MAVTYTTKLILAFNSGNRCAFENCRAPLTSEGIDSNFVVIGEAAHICGENPGINTKTPSARYKKEMTDDERNHYNNLIYLCPTCHTKIDKQEKDYPAELLFKFKKNHESWFKDQLDKRMSEVTFAELDVAARAIAPGKSLNNGNFIVLKLEDKIQKNKLGVESRYYLSMGLSRSSEVAKFLSEMSQLDDQFPIRLKDGFKQKYLEFKRKLSGDDLFMGMLEFAQSGQSDFKQQAASLAILSHLFQLCEVFEK